MGYIQRAAGVANFSSAVISIWFKVPQASITAKSAEWEAWAEGDGIDGDLIGVIPLVTFGPNTEMAEFTGTMETGELSPCVVGILCDNAGPHLYFRAQYDSGAQGYPIDYNDFFQVGGKVGTCVNAGAGTTDYIAVSADEWHHVLISFDFSGGCSSAYDAINTVDFVTTCPFHWAFDDVNYTGDYLGPNTPSLFGQAAAAAIISDLSLALQPAEPPENVFPPSYSFAAGNITTVDNPIGVPATADRVDHIYNVMMAELQIFTGVSLDTSIEENRRAFVTAGGRPAAPSLAASLLGQSPQVHFQTHTDFITGNNRGTEGDFADTGTISAYSPGP